MNYAIDDPRAYRSPWGRMLAKDVDSRVQDGFLWSDDKHLLFVLVQPKLGEAGPVGCRRGTASIAHVLTHRVPVGARGFRQSIEQRRGGRGLGEARRHADDPDALRA